MKGNWLFKIGNHSDISISALRDYEQTFVGKINFYARFKKRGARGSELMLLHNSQEADGCQTIRCQNAE